MDNVNSMLASVFKVSFTKVKIYDDFWLPRLRIHKDTTIETCLKRCEETGRIDNFSKAAGQMDGDFKGQYYNDSDVYKVLEGIAYSLQINPDFALEKVADQIIDKITAAQHSDGYLNTYFSIVAPEARWKDMEKHEDYCAGHMIEAAVAYYNATGKRKFLEVACRMANHMVKIFSYDDKHWVVGHQGIELALVKLYHATGEKKYYRLAQWFIEERGRGHGKGMIWDKEEWGKAYCQDDKPVRELNRVSGHAVRTMYYYSGISDVANVTSDEGYVRVLDKLWNNLTLKNMYITGGIGSSKANEGFTEDFDLPNESAYCETCASVGLVFWSHRMFLIKGEGVHIDILEKALYNCVIAGMSIDGNRFFYSNPMASNGTLHRQQWFDCSCCPTQIARFLPSIGDYIYAVSENEVWVNLFIAGEVLIQFKNLDIMLQQNTKYPWDGGIELIVDIKVPQTFNINLRFPGWCKSTKVCINSDIVNNMDIQKGYIKLAKEWKQGDKISYVLDMPVERAYSQPEVIENIGKVAIQRGPMVYCVEEVDNADFDSIILPKYAKFITEYRDDMLGGITVIKALNPDTGLIFAAVPYYIWDNRKAGKMSVWLDE